MPWVSSTALSTLIDGKTGKGSFSHSVSYSTVMETRFHQNENSRKQWEIKNGNQMPNFNYFDYFSNMNLEKEEAKDYS